MAELTGSPQVFHSNTDTIDGSQQIPLGTRGFDPSGNEYIYLQGVASTAAGNWVLFNESFATSLLTANDVGPVAIAMAAIVADKFGWYQVYGVNTIAITDTVAADKSLYIDGTNGRADDAGVAGDLIIGAYSRAADSSNVATVHIAYPSVSDDIGGASGSVGGSDTQVQFNDGGSLAGDSGMTFAKATNTLTVGEIIDSGLTASEIVATNGSKQLVSLAVATYPSLTELAYVKGVTSAIQTQIDTKQASGAVLDDLNTLGAASSDGEFIVATGAGAFAYESGATARTSLGLGTAAVEAWGAILDDLVALGAPASDGEFIVATGAGAFAYESGATARTSLGLGSAALVATDLADLNEATIEAAIDTLANLTSIQGLTVTLADAGADAILGWDDTAGAYENLSVAEVVAIISGTIAYSDLANGTDGELITWDAAGAPATVGAGTSGQVLTSNGAGAAPTFQAAAGGSPTIYWYDAMMFGKDGSANVVEGTGHNGLTPTVEFADGATGIAAVNTQVPEGYSSISSIVLHWEDNSASVLQVYLKFYCIHWNLDTVGNADNIDTTDSDTQYASNGTAGTNAKVTVPSGAYDGLTLDTGDYFAVQARRAGGDANDTYGLEWDAIAFEITWAA